MKRQPSILAVIFLLAIVGLVTAGTKLSQMRRTTTVASNDLFMVVRSTDGKRTNFTIEARNVATGLGPWITNSGSGGGGSATNEVLVNIISTGAVTNKFNRWLFWINPANTNSFFAENRGLGITTNSTDFGALVQSIANRGVDGAHFQLVGNPYYNAHYVISNSSRITLTNWITFIGDGNPSTVIRGAPGVTGPLIKLGDATHFISGISRFEHLRFEGEGTSAGSVGVQAVNTAEPVFYRTEFTGFLHAGLQISTLYNTAWAEANECWFVQKGANSHGILFDLEPSVAVGQNHFSIKNCIFGNHTSGGSAITVSNRFPGLVIQNSHFRNYEGVSGKGIMLYAGGDFKIEGNQFQRLSGDFAIQFADRLAATNYSSSVRNNQGWSDGIESGHSELIYIGEYVQGVSLAGNMAHGASASYITAGVGNGPINNFDNKEFRLGSISRSNSIPYLDAEGIMQPVTLSGLTLSGGTLTATGSTNPVVLAAGSLLSSNVFLQKVAHLGTNNVQVWDASTSMVADVQMFGNTTLVFTNMGTFTNYAGTNWTGAHVARVRNVSGTLTIASPQPITFSSTFIGSGKTNWLTIRYQNGAWHGWVSEVQTTGTEGSAYVLATAPTISGATIALASGSTNLIESQTEDTTPTTNDTVLVHDKDTASLKRVAIANLRGTSSGGGMAALEVQTNGVRAGLITNVNFGNGFTGAVSGSTITLAEYRTGASIGEVSVLDYGADLTGATDSTLAFQAAATNPAVYIPPGTYVITNVIVTNATIRGLVGKSIVRFNTNAVPYGFMFDTKSNLTHWRGITFDGGSTTNLRAFTTSDEARSGLKMYIAGDATVQNCTFINWHSNAVYVSGTNDITGRANHFRFQDNTITNCWTGLHLPSPNLAEYSIVTGNKIAWCNIGLRNDNANVTVAGNSIHDCATGLTSYDTTAGRSHSRYTGNTFHHTKVSWQNALTGFGFVGNNMLGSTTVELLAPAFGGLFEGNYFEQFTVTDYSGGTNWFFGNQISGTISQGGTSTSIYEKNRYTTGIPVSEVSSLTYVTTNIHIHPMRANNFAVILTNNAGFTIGTGGDGQIIRLRLTQDGTGSRTVAWTNLFNFSTTYPAPTLSTGIGKTDWIEAQYWTASNRWDVIRTDIGH